MIIDSNLLRNTKVTDRFIIGEAASNTRILQQGELIFIADGVRNFVEQVNKHFPQPARSQASGELGGDRFHQFLNWDETMHKFLRTPHELVNYDPTELRPSDYMEQGMELEYDVTGDFIDMGRHMEGIPEVFGSLHNGNPRARRVRIYVDNGHSGSISQAAITQRSERIIRLIDALENTNVRVELVVVDSGKCAHSECVVKRFDESLVLEDVAVATHPEFLRRICFRIIEHSKTFSNGYGSSLHLKNNMDVFKSKINDELSVFVHSNMTGNSIPLNFNKLEKQLVAELSEPVPSLGLVEIDSRNVRTMKL